MIFKTGTRICGFTVTGVRTVDELDSDLIEMTHDKTGAALCWMDNKAQNKLFSVAFKTVPFDDTGIFHILEHSVFCGSRNYPVKDPFVYLMKSSMNTFLNAMTYPDKTVFPVSSRNGRDFLNLTSIYLDAVFSPLLEENPYIFRQEGIRTEINGGTPSYNGVVFNEMKGAMSDVDSRIEHGLNRLMFPDTCYRFNYGGDPSSIPGLTYEACLETYRKFYHPANARFFLDGDIPLYETLELIDRQLQGYGGGLEVPEIPVQIPVSNEDRAYYDAGPGGDISRRAILSFGKIIGSWKDKTRIFAAKVLCETLAGTNESPLKRALLSSGLAEDLDMDISDDIAQPYLALTVRNTDDAQSGKVKALIADTVRRLIDEGLDKRSLLGTINRLHYSSKQPEEPQGLDRALGSLSSWLYGGDPLMYLLYDETTEELRSMALNGGFEELLRELLADETGLCILHMLPSRTLGEEEARLNALTDEERDELIAQNEEFLNWQQSPDPKDAAEKMPVLELSSVDDVPEDIPTEVTVSDGVRILHHPLNTRGNLYFSLYFPMTDYSLEELNRLSLLPFLFGALPTTEHSAADLQKEINEHIGSLDLDLICFGRDGETERCTPCLTVRAGVLERDFSRAKELVAEILTKTRFDDAEKIREIVIQSNNYSYQAAITGGQQLGLFAVLSHYTAKGAVNEAVNGYSAIRAGQRFADDFDRMYEDFTRLAERVQKETVCRKRLTVSLTGKAEPVFGDLFAELPEGTEAPADAHYKTCLPVKMGIRIPSQVSYAVKGYDLSLCGKEMTGGMRVAANIVSLCYLWDVLIAQNGAYDAGFTATRDGALACYSYRDPSPWASLEAYDEMPGFIRGFCESGESLDGYIISTVAASDPLISPEQKGMIADEFWFSGITYRDRVKLRRRMLATGMEDLAGLCAAAEKMAEEGAVCVVGNDAALEECGDLTILDL